MISEYIAIFLDPFAFVTIVFSHLYMIYIYDKQIIYKFNFQITTFFYYLVIISSNANNNLEKIGLNPKKAFHASTISHFVDFQKTSILQN